MEKLCVVMGDLSYGLPFKKLGLKMVHSVEPLFKEPRDVALVVFSGGEDVHPSLYQGLDRGVSYTNLARDTFEKGIFNQCRQYSIKMAGICRGFQFLNVMAGGRMYQHLDGHALWGRHPARFIFIDQILDVSSTHHQLVQLPDGSIPLVWAKPKRSAYYITPDATIIDRVDKEMEGALFPNANAMGVQYHPEMMADHEPGRKIFVDLIDDFLKLTMNEMILKYDRRQNDDSRRTERAEAVGGFGGEAA